MRISITRKWMQGLLVGALVLAVSSCSDDGGGTGPEQGFVKITATHIIVNPKSPAPGDTVQLTVDLESDTTNVGDFPTVTWTASGGTFLDNNETSVRWVAPATSALFDIDVTAKNSVNTTGLGTTVFVGESSALVASNAGQPFLRANGVDFVYMRTPDITAGLEMYEYVGGSIHDLVPGEQLGGELALAPSLTGAAYEVEPLPTGNFIEPINIVYSNLVAGTLTQITFDQAAVGSRRRQQYTHASFSNDGTMLCYQGLRPATLSSDTDSMDVFVYDTVAKTTKNVTRTHGLIRKNFFPHFSTDGNWLVFVSDRDAINKWEFYGLPIAGGVIPTDSASTVRLTTTGGQVTSGSVLTITPPFVVWNPVNPVMAMVSTTGAASQIALGASGATLTTMTGLGSSIAREFVWSDDGTMLAMSDNTRIFTAPLGGGVATLRHTGTEGDQLRDLTWSEDLNYIVFRVTRGGVSWFELLDVSAGVLDQTVVLTPASNTGDVSTYRRSMSTSAVYTPANELLMLNFNNETPLIELLDISGAVQ